MWLELMREYSGKNIVTVACGSIREGECSCVDVDRVRSPTCARIHGLIID